jgi:hypothetical protein
VVAAIFMGLTIAPLTIRNYRVFGKLVPVSTNGGDVFYRANNPLAFGGYTTHGERDLAALENNEVVWNRTGYAWGLEWIRRDPFSFIKLIAFKQWFLLGRDTAGFDWTVKKGHGNSGPLYKSLQTIANLWWIGIWVFALIGGLRWRHFLADTPTGALLLWMILYWVAIHSVFESHDRHHMPFVGVLVIISALAFVPPRPLEDIGKD